MALGSRVAGLGEKFVAQSLCKGVLDILAAAFQNARPLYHRVFGKTYAVVGNIYTLTDEKIAQRPRCLYQPVIAAVFL